MLSFHVSTGGKTHEEAHSLLEENIGATTIELSPDDLREIESATSKITVQGDQYLEELEQRIGHKAKLACTRNDASQQVRGT